MERAQFIAFDLGAQSGRGMVGEVRDGILNMRELNRFPNSMISIRGRLHWNLFNLFEQMKQGLRLLASETGEPPRSIGIDTWGVDFGLLARDGSILGLPYGYRDSRTEGAGGSFFAKIPWNRVYELTGIQFLPFNTLYQLEAMVRDKSPLLDIATDLLFIPDLFHYLLTGKKKTEFSFATTSQLYNPLTKDWEDELLAALGLPRTIMQEIVMPGSVIGSTNDEITRETSLVSTSVVAVATHDTGSAVAAVPADGDDWAYISSGTWSLMGIETKSPIITEQARDLNFTNEGGVEGTFRFLKNISGLWLLSECRRAWAKEREYTYDDLLEAASSAPPFKTLIDPDWQGFLSPPDMPGAIRRFAIETRQPVPDSKGDFVRCILESLALKYRLVLDQLRNISPHPVQKLHVIGGGAQNALLCRFTANATGLSVVAGPVEATAIGNIMVQALASDCVSSLVQMREVIRRSFKPAIYDPEQTTDWNSAYDRFVNTITSKD